MAADTPAYWPSEGERVVITRTGPNMGGHPVIGTTTEIMPYHQDDLGTWVGGWNFDGKSMTTGKETHGSWACTEMVARYNRIHQIVRPATEAEWKAHMG